MSEESAAPVAPAEPVETIVQPSEAPVEEPKPEPVESEPTPKAEEPANQDDNLPKPEKKQSAFDKRIATLNRRIGEEKARREFLEQQIEQLRPKQEADSDGLTLEQFEFDVEKYAEAKAKKAEERALKRYEEEQKTNSFKQQQARIVSDWEEKTSNIDSKYDDFDEVVGELQPNSHLNIAIMQAENGADVAYYLGTNLKEAQRIAQLDPVSAIREIGKIEARLATEPPKVKEVSKAPEPIAPIENGRSKTDKSPNEMSQKEFEAWRKKIISQRR